jgi:hypothetical protein
LECCESDNNNDDDDENEGGGGEDQHVTKGGAAASGELTPFCGKWATADGYNMRAFEQTENVWPINHPLPLPMWSEKIKPTLNFEKVSSVYTFAYLN